MRVAYVNYGAQSGVTGNVIGALEALGHELAPVNPTTLTALRAPCTRVPRPTPRVLMTIAASVLRHGRQALRHRLNTPYAFDVHSRRAGQLIDALPHQPDVVLQNGALFAPGRAPRLPYVLLLDNTCLLAERHPAVPEAGIGSHIRYARSWLLRERATYRGAHAIGTFSEVVRRSLIHDYGVDRDAVAVVGAGANIAPKREPLRRDDGRTLLFVGKEFHRKGGPVLLRAFSRLRLSRPDLHLFIAGPNEPLDLPRGATSLGLVPLEGVERLLGEATLFVLPTLREPFGIAFLDAMMCKVPCIGTSIDAVPEILSDAGILVPPADVDALARAIADLLDDTARARTLGEAGRRRVLERGYLWPEVAKRISALLVAADHTASPA